MAQRKLYGFMRDEKWWEDGLHILAGFVPMLGWVREHLQYPPGSKLMLYWWAGPRARGHWSSIARDGAVHRVYVGLDRVDDLYRDNLGYAIGEGLRFCVLVGLLAWRW